MGTEFTGPVTLLSVESTVNDLYCSLTPESVGAWAVYPYDETLASRYIVETRSGDQLILCKQKGDKLLVPRQLAAVGGTDRRAKGIPINVTSVVDARPMQIPLLKKAKKLLDAGENFVLEAGTGTGKTVMACDIIAHIGVKTLIIVTKDDLFRQWQKELKKFLPDSKIGVIRQNKYDVDGKDVVVAMLHSVCKPEKYPSSMRNAFGLVIWDEVHRVAADSFATTAGMFTAKLRLGLSATPKRWDGKEVLIHAHLGEVRVVAKGTMLTPIVGIYKTQWRCPRVMRNGQVVRLPHSSGKCGHVINALVDDMERNAKIMKLVLKAYKRGRRIVVFSDRIAHLELLLNTAIRAKVPPSDASLYISGMKKKELDDATAKHLIFATYGMMAEGTDIPWLDCCVLATPRSNVKQAVGRVLREYEGKPQPVVLDFADYDSPVFNGYAEKREYTYTELKSKVTRFA